ncbi:MAG: hypothetical protein ACRDKV_03450 [Solirubrobacterales bacterium]
MGSRERKRAERRKRKSRGAPRPQETPAAGEPGADDVGVPPGSPVERGYAKAEQRNREVREALEPLHEGQRPLVVTIGAAISALVAVSILIGFASGAEVSGERPELAQVLAPALLMAIMAWGMWRARYWAVLGFQTILFFLIVAAAFALALRELSAAQVAANVGLLAVAGGFFVYMVKAMARIQMPHRLPRD